MSTFSKRRAASAKLSKRVAAAAASVVLIGSSVPATVLSAVTPAFATAFEQKTTDALAGLSVSYTDKEVTSFTLSYSGSYTVGSTTGTASIIYTTSEESASYKITPTSGSAATVTAGDFEQLGIDTSKLAGMSISSASGYYVYGVACGEKEAAITPSAAVTVSENEVKNLGIENGSVLEITTDLVVADTIVAASSTSAALNTGFTVEMKDNDGKLQSGLRLNDLASIEAVAKDGYHFRAWSAPDTLDDATNPVVTGDELRALVEDETTVAAKAGVVDTSSLLATVEANKLIINFDAGEDGKLSSDDDKKKEWKTGDAAFTVTAVASNLGSGEFVGWSLDGEIVSDSSTRGQLTTTKLAEISGNEAEKEVTLTAVYGVSEKSEQNAVLNFGVWGGAVSDSVTKANDMKAGAIVVSGKDAKATESITGTNTGTNDTITLVPVTAQPSEGYDFVGWYRAASGTAFDITGDPISTEATLDADALKDLANHGSADGSGSNATIASTDFLAVFKASDAQSEYTVHYDLNGGTLKEGVLDTRGFEDTTFKLDGTADYAPATTEITKRFERKGYKVVAGDYTTLTTAPYITATDGTGKLVAGKGETGQTDLQTMQKGGELTLYINWVLDAGKATDIAFKAGRNGEVEGSMAYINKAAANTTDADTMSGDKSATATPKAGYHVTGWKWVAYDVVAHTTDIADGTINNLKADGTVGTSAFTGTELSADLVKANLSNVEYDTTNYYTVIGNATANAAQDSQSVVITASFAANNYTATFDGVKMSYTVGKDAELPTGTWYDEDGNVVADKAALDALTTKDNDVVVLTSKTTPETPGSPTTPTSPTSPTSPTTPTTPVGPTYKEGWNDVTGSGDWIWVENGEPVTNRWIEDGGNWYYLDNTGAMVTGWMQDGFENGVAIWYYLSTGNYGPKGKMATGWIFDGGWYYMNEGGYATYTGQMVRSKAVPGGTVGADGKWIA